MYQVTSKLEINVTEKSNPVLAADFAQKHRCPAIVAPPGMIAPLMANRAIKNGQYDIIATIDFPQGKEFALKKFRDLDQDFIACNGFDIMLTPGLNEVETRNEIRAIYEFLRNINRTYNIRYVLGAYTREEDEVVKFLKAMQKHPPVFIRLDQHLTLPNVNRARHASMAKLVSEHMPSPLKISGNVNLEMIDELGTGRNRFDVTLNQAVSILKALELRNNPQMQETAPATT